jgi:uncharacterized protein
MRFEWDEAKNRANIRKHGIDFADAATVFDGPMVIGADTREDYGEDRWIGVGEMKNQIVAIAFAERGPDSIRVISIRKASRHERVAYEEEIANRLGSD